MCDLSPILLLLFRYESERSVLLLNDNCLYMCSTPAWIPNSDAQKDIMKVGKQMSVPLYRRAN